MYACMYVCVERVPALFGARAPNQNVSDGCPRTARNAQKKKKKLSGFFLVSPSSQLRDAAAAAAAAAAGSSSSQC